MLGSNWDIVGFDPRGIWFSEPLASCSANLTYDENTALASRSSPRVVDGYYESYIEYGKKLGEQCEEMIGGETDAGPHMSTATTARDMLSIVDAFAETEDGKRAVCDFMSHFYPFLLFFSSGHAHIEPVRQQLSRIVKGSPAFIRPSGGGNC